MVVSPEHQILKKYLDKIENIDEVEEYQKRKHLVKRKLKELI